MKPQVLDMDSEVLAEFKDSLNSAIQIVIDQLTKKSLSSGEVSAKIKIALISRTDSKTGEVLIMPEIEPNVGMKIGAKGKLECQKQAGMILQKSPCGKPVVASNQVSIDELMDVEKGA